MNIYIYIYLLKKRLINYKPAQGNPCTDIEMTLLLGKESFHPIESDVDTHFTE